MHTLTVVVVVCDRVVGVGRGADGYVRLCEVYSEDADCAGHPFAAEEIEPAPGSMSLWLVSAHLLCPSKETMPLALIFYGHP